VIEIETIAKLERHLEEAAPMVDVVIQGLDLSQHDERLVAVSLRGTVLLGCHLTPRLVVQAMEQGALVFPELPNLPFRPYRGSLYSVAELYTGFDRLHPETYTSCLDARIYEHWKGHGRAQPDSILETLARRLHDHAITDALEEAIAGHDIVAIMGGHGMPRSRGLFADVARIARKLSRHGYLLATGGGPGAMEATHVGTWFADRDEVEMLNAIDVLAKAPRYDDTLWLAQAFEVRERWPLSESAARKFPSLGIPTWLYGHEPPNAFATMVAKYFANSVREDGLLAIAKGGVIYSPGSAGTIQEIFQDACQNHYVTHGVVSPMVFLGTDYWNATKPVYPLLRQLATERDYARWLSITDDVDEAVQAMLDYAGRDRA
jgi:predicted Rossmann-fold nucleotide-binding protein